MQSSAVQIEESLNEVNHGRLGDGAVPLPPPYQPLRDRTLPSREVIEPIRSLMKLTPPRCVIGVGGGGISRLGMQDLPGMRLSMNSDISLWDIMPFRCLLSQPSSIRSAP